MGISLAPTAASTIFGQALPDLGSLFGGLASGQLSQSQQAQNYALGKRTLADSEAELADQLQRQSQTNPLRDQAIYQLQGLAGASPAAFNPTSFLTPTNTGQQGVGGVNLNALAQRAAQYTPGAGGVTSNVQQMILNRLGYGNSGTGTMYDTGSRNTAPPPTPPDRLAGTPSAAQTTGATLYGGGTPYGQGGPSGQSAAAAQMRAIQTGTPTAAPPFPGGVGQMLNPVQQKMFGAQNAMAGGSPTAGGLTFAQRMQQVPGLGRYALAGY